MHVETFLCAKFSPGNTVVSKSFVSFGQAIKITGEEKQGKNKDERDIYNSKGKESEETAGVKTYYV
jgi:hypothetical protein